jgi:hypothetical protein
MRHLYHFALDARVMTFTPGVIGTTVTLNKLMQ